ncbi:hypothetical protein MAH4_24700 [Sessilibacter sp. MAH4]
MKLATRPCVAKIARVIRVSSNKIDNFVRKISFSILSDMQILFAHSQFVPFLITKLKFLYIYCDVIILSVFYFGE